MKHIATIDEHASNAPYKWYSKVKPKKFVIHTSHKKDRDSILKNGIEAKIGFSYETNWTQDEFGIIKPAVFAVDADSVEKAYQLRRGDPSFQIYTIADSNTSYVVNTSDSSAGTSYTWLVDDGVSITPYNTYTFPTLAVQPSTTYDITLIVNNGACSDTASIQADSRSLQLAETISGVSLSEFSTFAPEQTVSVKPITSKKYEVFPNPATSFFNLQDGLTYKLFNVTGELVAEGVSTGIIETINFAPGLYVLSVDNSVVKIIIQ